MTPEGEMTEGWISEYHTRKLESSSIGKVLRDLSGSIMNF